MKSPRQVKTDERDNRRVLRWVVMAVVVLVIGALSYNYFGRRHSGDEPSGQATTVVPPSDGSTTHKP